MTSSPEEALFALALTVPPSERATWLDRECGEDGALRQRLEALLAAHETPERLLSTDSPSIRPFPNISLSPVPDEAVGQSLGPYKLLERVGEGGCGVVYVAEQSQPVRRRVALKVIKLGMDTRQVVARFEAERQALAMMDHPNIAKVLDAGTTESGRPFFVMEWVRGIRITEYCDNARLNTQERIHLFIKVCHAIQHAHQKGIIHRDIKPSNILVTLEDGVPAPKVIDFGIAKATEGRLTDATIDTHLHHFIGTPAYMSPEQAEISTLDIDTRSDIYSLGVLLYELLTGTTPFDARELMDSGIDAMRKTIREKDPPRPSTRLTQALVAAEVTRRITPTPNSPASSRRQLHEVIHQLRGDLDWVVMKCLEKDRTRRYETANGLATDLKRHLAHEPVTARPPTPAYRFQKAFRRNRLSFVAVGAVAAALVIGLGVSTWQMVEARKARSAEREQRLAAQAAQRHAELAQAAEREERQRANAEKLTAQRHLYAANMNLVQQAWDQPHLERVQHLLNVTATSPFRGFEWYYWQRQTHLANATLNGHVHGVHALAFSPDGQRLVTGSGDHTAKVWDVATGRERLTLSGHTAQIWSVAFFPDGRRILTGAADQTARVWDTTSGRELLILKGHPSRIYDLAISPDGQQIATPSGDVLKIWSASDGRELRTLPGHSGLVYSVAFSPDGRHLLTGSGDLTARLWDAATGTPRATLKGHTQTVRSVAFLPDNQRCITASDDQTVRIWEIATGQEWQTLRGHTAVIQEIAVSPDGRHILTASDDLTAKVWDAATGRALDTLKGHFLPLTSVAYSPDGRHMATGSSDWTAKIWDGSSIRPWRSLTGHSAMITSVAFSPDRQHVVTGSEDFTCRVWDIASGRERATFKQHANIVRSLAFSPDGQHIVSGGLDQSCRLWDASTGREMLALHDLGAAVQAVGFSQDGQHIVACVGNVSKVWATSTGHDVLALQGYKGELLAVAFSPDGRRIVAGGGDESVAKVWDATTGQELLSLKGHTATIWSVAFSPDGQSILTSSGDATARLWDASTGQVIHVLRGHGDRVKSVAFSPDGQRIATGSSDQTVRVWETASGWDLLVLRGHQGGVDAIAFSQDGQSIFTGSNDQTVREWKAADPVQVVAWKALEREEEVRMAALERDLLANQQREEREHASEPGALKRWRVLAPIPFADGQNGGQALLAELIPGEPTLRPRAAQTFSFAGHNVSWRDVSLSGDRLVLNPIQGRDTLNRVAYAVCWIRSATEQSGLRMCVGGSTASTVFLNGERVHLCQRRRISTDKDTVPGVSLRAGINAVVFKLVMENNSSRGWWGSIRFTDAEGRPVQGIEATLDPESQN